ncbi:MAG: hypothetical protein RBJ76_02380 [Stenomitos frigidus ULC029]
MAGDEIFDSIRLRKDGVDFTQWPKLSCIDVSQLTFESSVLQITGSIKATSFQGDGSTLNGVVKKEGDTITGALTIQDSLYVTGNVSIGSANPSAKLHIYAPDNDALKITNTALSKTARMGVDELGVWIEPSETNSSIRLNANPNLFGLYINGADGKIGIGTSTPMVGLDVRGSTMWIGSGDSSQTLGDWRLGRWVDYEPNTWVYLSRTDSTAYQDLAVGALWAGGTLRFGTADDVAEMTPVKADDELEPGDVVVIAEPPDDRVLLKRSYQPYDARVAGVVSDAKTAGLVIGGSHPTDVNRQDVKPLALVGRVLTKVTAENGSIQVGDLLVTGSTPGCAMKATQPGYTLGKALQSFTNDHSDAAVGRIWVLIHLGWFGGS